MGDSDGFSTSTAHTTHKFNRCSEVTSKIIQKKIIPARDPKQCGGSGRIMYYNVDVDVDDDDDDDDVMLMLVMMLKMMLKMMRAGGGRGAGG